MSYTHKIVGKILGDKHSKNLQKCIKCGGEKEAHYNSDGKVQWFSCKKCSHKEGFINRQ